MALNDEESLIDLPKWALVYEETHKINHKQERQFIKALRDLHSSLKENTPLSVEDEKFNGAVKELIRKLCVGLYSDFDCDENCDSDNDTLEDLKDHSIAGLVHQSRDLGLEQISINAARGKYDHNYVLRNGQSYSDRDKKEKETLGGIFSQIFIK